MHVLGMKFENNFETTDDSTTKFSFKYRIKEPTKIS